MKKSVRFLLILSILLLCFAGANTAVLLQMRSTLVMNLTIVEWKSYLVAVLLVVMAFIHLISIINLGSQIKKDIQDNILRSGSFVLCIFSGFLLLVDVVMLQEIGKQILVNVDTTGEWRIVIFNHVVHILFSMFLLFYSLTSSKRSTADESGQHAMKDEAVFLTVQQVGVFTAVLGMVFILFLNGFQIPPRYAVGLLFMSTLILLVPYFLAVMYWIFTKRKEKPVEWYDEKQFQDVSRAALVTLLISVLGMGVVYGLYSIGVVVLNPSCFFPIYLFLTLLSFSGIALCMNKGR